MIVDLIDANIGTVVHINPDFVVSIRPEPTDPDHMSEVKLRDGEVIRVLGDHREVAGKLVKAA